MNNIILKLIVAAVTFGIGFASSSVWTDSGSIDAKLKAAISRVQIKNIETVCKRKALTPEECGQMKESVNSAAFAAQLDQDIASTNAGCRQNGLSAAACIARKEKAVRDIEETLLANSPPEPIKAIPSQRVVIENFRTSQEKIVLIERLP